jgi:hypothetical protein
MTATQEDDEGNVTSDPREISKAIKFNNEVVMSQAEVRAAAAAQRERQTPSSEDETAQAESLVKAKYGDLDDYKDDMTAVVDRLSDADRIWLRQLAESGVEGKERAIEHVYLAAKAARPSNSAKAREAEKARRRTSAEAATLAATSPTAEGTSTRTPPPAAEAEGLRRKRGLRERMNLKIEDGVTPD